jgi:thiol-disulfide isomerase/thioredoxin
MSTRTHRIRRLSRIPALLAVLAVGAYLALDFGHHLDRSAQTLAAARQSSFTRYPAAQRRAAPVLTGTSLDGAPLTTATWTGHVIVVNFWGSWCSPCRREAPQLARTAADTAHLGVHFVGVDVLDNPGAGTAFERQFAITYPSFSDPSDALAADFGPLVPVATPETFVIDARGRIAALFIGATTFESLDPVVHDIAAGH